jgi:hypothetical protein
MKNFTENFVSTLNARNAEQTSKDTVLAINNATKNTVALDAVFTQKHFHTIASKLLECAKVADKKQDKEKFIAVKVLVKIVSACASIGKNMKSELDPYSQTILENLIELQGITNKDALVCLSRSVEYDEFEQQAHLVKRYNCSANTAGTQASSTRMMLKALDVCNVEKGKKGDVISFKDNERARALIALFQPAINA